MSKERQMLHQPTLFALRGICRAQHAPLGRLQSTWSCNLPTLLKVGTHAHHGTKCRHERETR